MENTYIKIIGLIKALEEDFGKPGNSSTFNDQLKDTIGALKDLKSFY